MIEKKPVINAIKRALQSGSFQLVGQELTDFPSQLLRLDTLNLEDQNWWDCNPITKIDLSNNSIGKIPADLIKLPDIQLIRLKNNQIMELTPTIFQLQNLKSLDLAKNKLRQIPKEIELAKALVELILTGNQLTSVPNKIHGLQNLQSLYLDSNKIAQLPILPSNLKRLDISSNKLTVIHAAATQQSRLLQYINLNKNQIQEIERGAFSQCKSLISLQMKENRLSVLVELPLSDKLDTINASFNRIHCFDQFENCPNLTVLILSDNKIQKLSGGILHLKKLKTLDISNNDLSDLPSELGLLPSLVRIQLEGNPLKCIRQNVRMAGAEQLKKYLKERLDVKDLEKMEKKVIDPRQQMNSVLSPWQKLVMQFTTGAQLTLRSQNLQALDPVVFKPHIKVLNLSQNKIKTIGSQIAQMTQLQILNLGDNQLQSLPIQLLQLSTLQQLELRKNKFQNLFHGHNDSRLERLYFVDMSVNKLSHIPPFLLSLKKLRIIHLSYNKIDTLQPLFSNKCLPLLEVIDASNNQLTELSQNVGNKYHTLNFLNVQNNNIGKLPTILGFMKLTALKVDGNPLKLIKRTVIDKGTVSLMQDLRTKHQGAPPQFEHQVQPPPQPKKIEEQPPYYKPEPPVKKPQQSLISQKQRQDIQNRIAAIGREIASIQQEIQNNLSLNKIQKGQKKRTIQALLIERNKLQQMPQ